MKWWQKNLALKVIALVLAIMTWLYVNSVTSDWRTLERIPVQVRLPVGFSARVEPSTVDVVVRGAREDLRQVGRQDLSAVLNLTRETTAGPIAIKLSPDNVKHPPRVQVVEVRPGELVAHLEAAAPPRNEPVNRER